MLNGNLYIVALRRHQLRNMELCTASRRRLSATDIGDELNGAGGDDTIYGGGGNDTIHGGDDDDLLFGDADDDQLYGDAGADTLDGGTGNDIFYVDNDDYIVNEATAPPRRRMKASRLSFDYQLYSHAPSWKTSHCLVSAQQAVGNDRDNCHHRQ